MVHHIVLFGEYDFNRSYNLEVSTKFEQLFVTFFIPFDLFSFFHFVPLDLLFSSFRLVWSDWFFKPFFLFIVASVPSSPLILYQPVGSALLPFILLTVFSCVPCKYTVIFPMVVVGSRQFDFLLPSHFRCRRMCMCLCEHLTYSTP